MKTSRGRPVAIISITAGVLVLLAFGLVLLRERREEELKPAPARGQGPPRVMVGLVVRENADSSIAVASVMPGSPAEQAGLRKDDVLRALAGSSVKTLDDMMAVLQRTEPGRPIGVVAERLGQRLDLTMVPRAR